MSDYCDRFPSILVAYCSHCQGTMKRIPELRGKRSYRPSKGSKAQPLYKNLREIEGSLWVDCKVCDLPIRFSDAVEATVILKWKDQEELERGIQYSRATQQVEDAWKFKSKRIPVTVKGLICRGCRATYQHTVSGARRKVRDQRIEKRLDSSNNQVTGRRGYNDA